VERAAAADNLEAERRAIARLADQQHVWVLPGDEREVYGAYPPTSLG
jgi:hypothetical protein